MTKILLVLTVLMAVVFNTATAKAIRRRGGGAARGEKGAKPVSRRTTGAHSARHLKGGYHYAPPGAHKHAQSSSKSKGNNKGGMMMGMNGGGGGEYGRMMDSRPKCRPVVEGAEFIVEGAITMTMANMTEDESTIGTEFIYNGPLLEFNDRDELTELENFFLSGTCVRTQERDDEMPGAGHCAYTVTLDTGATMNFGGEAFDGWDNLMGINGGSQELIGLSGTVTLIGLDDNFEDTSDDFFSVPWIYGEAVLVYSICPQGYWDRYYIEDHDALPPPSIPDPFQRNVVETEVLAVVVTPGDDDALHHAAHHAGYDHADDDGYDYNY